MGVDFYTCANEECRSTFPDCGDYYRCGCERYFCSDECAKSHDIEEGDPLFNEDDASENVTCLYCRGEEVADKDLLSYALYCLGMDRARFTKQFVEVRRMQPPCAKTWCQHTEGYHTGPNGACAKCPETEKRDFLWCKEYQKPDRL